MKCANCGTVSQGNEPEPAELPMTLSVEVLRFLARNLSSNELQATAREALTKAGLTW